MIADILTFALFVMIVWGSFIGLLIFALRKDRHAPFTRGNDNH